MLGDILVRKNRKNEGKEAIYPANMIRFSITGVGHAF